VTGCDRCDTSPDTDAPTTAIQQKHPRTSCLPVPPPSLRIRGNCPAVEHVSAGCPEDAPTLEGGWTSTTLLHTEFSAKITGTKYSADQGMYFRTLPDAGAEFPSSFWHFSNGIQTSTLTKLCQSYQTNMTSTFQSKLCGERSWSSDSVEKRYGYPLPISTCSQTLLQLSKHARERCDEKRQRYATLVGMENPQRLVFIDETSIDLRTTYRLMGWADVGSRAVCASHFVQGTR
jgi:hypothetical protein